MEEDLDPRMERVVHYVEDEMDAAERVVFEKEMADDPSLRSDVEAARRTIGGLRTLGEKRLREELKAAEAEFRRSTASSRSRWWWAAAAIVVLGGLGWWLAPTRSTPQELAEEFNLEEPGLPVLMGASPRTMDAIMNAYKLGELDVSVRLIEQALAAAPGNDTLSYFAAVIAMRQGRIETALEGFAALDTASVFSERARFHRAIGLLRKGELGAAREVLQHAAQAKDPQVSARARELLDRL